MRSQNAAIDVREVLAVHYRAKRRQKVGTFFGDYEVHRHVGGKFIESQRSDGFAHLAAAFGVVDNGDVPWLCVASRWGEQCRFNDAANHFGLHCNGGVVAPVALALFYEFAKVHFTV